MTDDELLKRLEMMTSYSTNPEFVYYTSQDAAARIRELKALVQSIDQIIDAKSEMFTLDTDVLENIKDRIRAAQPERQQGE